MNTPFTLSNRPFVVISPEGSVPEPVELPMIASINPPLAA